MASPPQPALPPLPLLSLATLIVFLVIACSTGFAIHSPWLGLEAEPGGSRGLKVTAVHSAGPLHDKILPGDHLISIQGQGQPVSLRFYDPAHNPHAESRFEGYNAYMEYQGRIASALHDGAIRLAREDGPELTVEPFPSRPLSSLPISFWLLNLFGAMACLVGLSVWMFRPGHWPARLLALSGGGFFLATSLHSIWNAREIALLRDVFEFLMRGNHAGLHLLLVSLLCLMAIYPRRLPAWKWLVCGLIALAVLQQINENLQAWTLFLHTFYLPLGFYYLAGVVVAIIQWRMARHHPLDRSALRWLFLSILLAMGGGMLVYFLPAMLGYPPFSSLTTMVGIASTLYIGFALGILRYRLFQIERWWFVAWGWFLAGLLVLVVDLLVISLLGVNQGYALTFSLLAVGWLYLPFRQWLWRRLSPSTEVYMERYLPGFVESLFTSPPGKEAEHWRAMLVTVFQPLTLDSRNHYVEYAELSSNGARLLVPSFDEAAPTLSLLYGQRGRRLFTQRDRDLAEALGAVASRVCNLREARMAGASQERKRIMRDLHDDIGGRLLTLMHTADDQRYVELARGALSALRETIYALDEQKRYNLQDMLEEFRSELEERLSPAGVQVIWQTTNTNDRIELPPRHFINIRRVLNEAASNALQHGADAKLCIAIKMVEQRLEIELENGLKRDAVESSSSYRGRGLNNIETRIAEIGGEIDLFCRLGPEPRFCLHATIPIPVHR
jgi:signal transduction histidine kinase